MGRARDLAAGHAAADRKPSPGTAQAPVRNQVHLCFPRGDGISVSVAALASPESAPFRTPMEQFVDANKIAEALVGRKVAPDIVPIPKQIRVTTAVNRVAVVSLSVSLST